MGTMRNSFKNLLLYSILSCFICFSHAESKKRQINAVRGKDIEAIRSEIFNSQQNIVSISRDKSTERLAEINLIKDNILNSSAVPFHLSANLSSLLKEATLASPKSSILGMILEEPNINIIDEHVKEIVNPNSINSFQPNDEEIKVLTKLKHSESNINNLYRENLRIKIIQEEKNFKIGKGIEQWKTILLEKDTVFIGRSKNNSILMAIGSFNNYEVINEFKIEEAISEEICIETLNIWDNVLSKIRNIILIGANGNLIWYEIINDKDIIEIFRWRLMKTIDKVSYLNHDGSDLLMITTIDQAHKIEVEIIEFNFQNSEFWVVQAFKLQSLPKNIAFFDAGRDMIAAFTQESFVTIYRHQSTKFERGKFSLLKNIDAANVSDINGFRIGGHSYLAIGGDQPQILRYLNDDFYPQTILSQTFGHVDKFLAIPIKIYRDDLVLLVEHSIKFRTHTLTVVDALIWNGIAFENAFSIPCKITADPNASGFTCILDLDRDEGLLGASYVVTEKNNSFYIIIPRFEAHSGLFKVEYEIVEAEDPLMKEIENVKRAIELINGMLDLETSVKQKVEQALSESVNPKKSFEFEDILLDEINADIIHFDGNVTIESNKIEFLDMSYSHDEFKTNLDEIEKTLAEDEQKVKEIDSHLNKLIRKNRQVTSSEHPILNIPDSQIHYPGPYSFNGQLDIKTLRVLPNEEVPEHRQKRQVEIIPEQTLNELQIDEINVKNVNGLPIDDWLFLDENGLLDVPDSNIVFQGSVHADNIIMLNDGKVNGIDFSKEVLAVDSPNFPKDLTFDEINCKNLYINQLNDVPVDLKSLQNISTNFDDEMKTITTNEASIRQILNIETINGINFTELMSKIVLFNEPSNLINLTVNGNLVFMDSASAININTLNSLSFPEHYVLKVGPETIIQGIKTFKNKLYTKAVDTDGTVNGIEPSNIITLDQPQSIYANTTFNVVEVMKKLEVDGTVSGRKLEDFLQNPTLEHSKEIPAECTFRELVVEGSIELENSMNGQNIKAILSDVVYEGEDEEVVITGLKTFRNLELQNDATILSNYINNVKIDSIMTKDTEQVVTNELFYGDIFFSNLKLHGLFDGINATELEMNSIRTFGDQFIQTPLNVTNHLSANSISIKNSINDILAKDYYFINEPVVLPQQMKVGMYELSAKNMIVNNDILGNAMFNTLNLKDFEHSRLSKSKIQNIIYPVEIDRLYVDEMFNGKLINGMNFEVFKEYLMSLKNFKANLLSGKHKLDNLIIDGDVNLQYINDKDFEFIKNHAIWLNKPNNKDISLEFLDEIEIHEGLNVEHLMNGKNYANFLKNWISKNENSIIINSDKTIETLLMVEENLDVEEINNIPYDNILRNRDVLEMKNLNILGTIDVSKLYVKRSFNRERASTLQDAYFHDKDTNTLTINTDIRLPQRAQINNLNTPYLNKLNVSFWLNDLIRFDDNPIYLKGKKIFKMPIKAESGVYIDTFNDLNIKSLTDNMVIIKSNEIITVRSNIHFLDDFRSDLIGLKGNLTTDFISGIYLDEWILNALPIHKDILYKDTLFAESQLLKVSNMNVDKINGIPFDSIFTLNTNQTFDYNIVVEGSVDVKNPLIVNNLVNQMNLKLERDNTVMLTEKEQEIHTNIILSEAVVLNSVTIKGLINSRHIENIIVLNSSPVFDSSLTFQSLEVPFLYSNDRISGINFTKWYENVLWKKGKDVQRISGKWKLNTAHLEGDVSGNGLINGQSIGEIEKNLNKNVHEIEMALNNYSVEYRSMCDKLHDRANKLAKSSIYILKYFEDAFKITEDVDIFSYYFIQTKKKQYYLFVNTNCTTNIYKWMRSIEKFKKLNSVETGVVYSWNKLEPENNDELFILTNSKMIADVPCYYGGTNSWRLVNDKLIHLASISKEADILELFVHPSNSKGFYVLKNSDHIVNYDAYGYAIEHWKLPYDNFSYSFVPADVLTGLNVNNGRRIFSLDSKFIQARKHRSVDSNAPFLKILQDKSHLDDSPTYTILKPEIPNYSIPTIPSKAITTTKRISFLSKVKDAGDVIRRSFNNTPKMSVDSTKFAKFDDFNSNNSTLIFSIKTPNVTALKEKFMRNRIIPVYKTNKEESGENTDDQEMSNKVKELQNIFEDKIKQNESITTERNLLKSEDPTTEGSTKINYEFTPRVIMPEDEQDVNELTEINNNLLKAEPVVDSVTVMTGRGIRDAENYIIPEHGQGEIITLHVGTENNKKSLYVISRKRNSVIQGDNLIEIYSDIINGRVFQYIVCTNPSNIHALHFRDETLLAFLESRREVKVYIYRGIQGFTLFKTIALPEYAYKMTSVALPAKLQYKCDQRYLVFHFEKELLFMAVKVDGNCGLKHIECDGI